MGRREKTDAPRPAVDLVAEAAAIERVLGRLEEVERTLRAIDAEVERILDDAGHSARPNPRRAHELLITAVNAVAAAEGRLRRRIAMDREAALRGPSDRE